jgi:hypothetical protein
MMPMITLLAAKPATVHAEICGLDEYSVVKSYDTSTGKASFGCAKIGSNMQAITDNANKSAAYIRTTAATFAGLSLGVTVLMIIYASIVYTTAQGDPKRTQEAKHHLTTAGIGLGITMFSFVIYAIIQQVLPS